jgi:hypothetical protein
LIKSIVCFFFMFWSLDFINCDCAYFFGLTNYGTFFCWQKMYDYPWKYCCWTLNFDFCVGFWGNTGC